jgi:hypothetical protein
LGKKFKVVSKLNVERNIVRTKGWNIMNKQKWVSKVATWRSLIRSQTSRAKIEDGKRRIKELRHYLENIGSGRVKKEEERWELLDILGFSFLK